MVIFFFIGTGKLVKETGVGLSGGTEERHPRALSGFKRRTSPAATFALFSSIAVFVLGGAAHTRALPPWTHLAASLGAVAIHFWALAAEWRAFGENTVLMNDPRAFARRVAGAPTAS